MANSLDKFRKGVAQWSGNIGSAGVSDAIVKTVPLASSSNLPTDTAVMITVNRVDANGKKTGNYEGIVGVVSGSNLIDCIRGVEGTAQAWTGGTVVEVLHTASNTNELINGILAEHNQDGTHKALPYLPTSYLDTDATLADNSDEKIPSQKATKAYVDGKVTVTADSTTTFTNKTLTSPVFQGSVDGWISANETWTYASADDTTFTFTVAADVTGKYSAGMKIKLTQGTVKYFIITAISAYSGGNTTITVYGGTDYDLASSAISANAYSTMRTPVGFPMSPAKWSVVFSTNTQVTQASPTNGTVYSTGYSIDIPIGVWDITFQGLIGGNSAGTEIRLGCALSTATNSISNNLFRVFIGANGLTSYFGDFVRRGTLEVSSKTTHYIVFWTTRTNYTNIFFGSGDAYSFVTATCAYL